MPYKYFLAGLLALGQFAHANELTDKLPDIGDSASQVLSIEQEQNYGDYIIREIRRELPIVTDPLINYYIDSLGFRLVSQIPQSTPRQFEFFAVKDPEINAFALPGGYIGIHTGLLSKTENESELASVISHEIAHVLQRHIARRIEQNSQMSIPSMAALAASILLTVINPEVGLAGLYSTQATQQQMMLNFSRNHESEADRIGIQTLANAGLDTNAMASFFDKLLTANQHRKNPLPFLSTHPLTQDRIADARNRAKAVQNVKIYESIDYYFARARALRLTHRSPEQLRKQYESLLKKQPSVHLKYGYALTLIDVQAFEAAQAVITDITQQSPDDIFLQLLQIELWLKQQNNQAALQHCEHLLSLYPGNLPISLYKAQSLLQLEQYQDSIRLLRPLTHKYPSNTLIFEQLVEAYAKHGDQVSAHETQSQLLFLTGNYDRALQQLNLARAFPDLDTLTQARLDARIQQIKQVMLELKQ